MKLSSPKFGQVLQFLQICNSVVCTWPHDSDVSKLIFVLRKMYYSFTILNTCITKMTLIYAIYKYWHDITTIMKILAELTCTTELLINVFICKLKRVHIQHTLMEIKNFLRTSNDHERIILQKYIDRYAFFTTFVILCYFIAIITFCCTPIFTAKKFPTDGLYPFPTESPLVIFIIYAMQVYAVVQCGFCVSVDFMFAVFFLYSAARLEMLCLEIQTARNEEHIDTCIKKHQEIIKFVDGVKYIVYYSLLITNFMMAIGAICGTFPIIHKQMGTIEFIFLVIGGCQRLYITAWPTDDLMENGKQIATGIYNISWIGSSQSIIKKICFIMHRSQKSIVINMGYLLPTLSLKYCAKYLITLLSYFMTMRAIIYDTD
ncbi:hypothetical protein PUN28_002781 [Cardiocondyla obscurior]